MGQCVLTDEFKQYVKNDENTAPEKKENNEEA